MFVSSIVSFVLAGLVLVGGALTEETIRLSSVAGCALFVVLGVGLLIGRRAVQGIREDVLREVRTGIRVKDEGEAVELPSVLEKPGIFLREQDMVFGPNGKGAFSVSFWFDEGSTQGQEYLGMHELDYLFLELEGDYKLSKRKEEVQGRSYILYAFQSGYQVDFNQSRYIQFREKEDKSYMLQIKIGRLNAVTRQHAADTLLIKATLPARISMANSMTYEDRTVEWRLTGAHFRKDLTLKAFTTPLRLS